MKIITPRHENHHGSGAFFVSTVMKIMTSLYYHILGASHALGALTIKQRRQGGGVIVVISRVVRDWQTRVATSGHAAAIQSVFMVPMAGKWICLGTGGGVFLSRSQALGVSQ